MRVVETPPLASPRGARAVEKDDEDEVEDGHRNEPGSALTNQCTKSNCAWTLAG